MTHSIVEVPSSSSCTLFFRLTFFYLQAPLTMSILPLATQENDSEFVTSISNPYFAPM
jgi:hypothetical protein